MAMYVCVHGGWVVTGTSALFQDTSLHAYVCACACCVRVRIYKTQCLFTREYVCTYVHAAAHMCMCMYLITAGNSKPSSLSSIVVVAVY